MKKVLVFIILFLLAGVLDASFIASSLQEARAMNFYKDKKYDQALKIYNQLAASKPYDARYNYNIGDILYKSGKFQEAISYYQRAIEHGDMQMKVQSTFNIGNVHMQLKAYDDAIVSYENVLKMHPDNQPAKHNLEVVKKLKEHKEQEDQKQDQEQKQESKDQENNQNDQDEKQGQENQQQEQKQDSSSDKNSKNDKKQSGDQKGSDKGKDQKNDSSEKKEDGSNQKQGQKDQQKEQQAQKEETSKKNAEKSDEEIEQDLAQAQKEQREQEKQKEKQQSAPQSGNSSEEKQFPQQLDDSLYQEMQKSAADDDRLSKKEAQLMEQMEDLEKQVAKNVMKHMIRAQTAGSDHGKNW